MKKTLATLTGVAIALSAMGAPVAFADTTSGSSSSQVTATSTQGTVDAGTQTQANSDAGQVLNDASQSGQVSGTASADGKQHTGKGSVVDQIQDIINHAVSARDHRQDLQQLKFAVLELRITQKAIHVDQQNLLNAAHQFANAIRAAEKAGDKQAVLKGITTSKQILGTLRNALNDESHVYADIQLARLDARTGHVDKALVLMHDAVTKEKAKADAMKQAALSLRLLAADINAHVKNSTDGSSNTQSTTGTESDSSTGSTGTTGSGTNSSTGSTTTPTQSTPSSTNS